MSEPIPEGATQPQFNINDQVTIESDYHRVKDIMFTVQTMSWWCLDQENGFWQYSIKSTDPDHTIASIREPDLRHYNPIWPDLDKLWRVLEDEAQRQLGLDITITSVEYLPALKDHIFVHCEGDRNFHVNKEGVINHHQPLISP